MPDRRCRRRRQLSLPVCLLPPPRRLSVCDRREMRVGERTRHQAVFHCSVKRCPKFRLPTSVFHPEQRAT
eukprot:scaffold23097_cov58-Phaeocystis_antarctica.AAC.2